MIADPLSALEQDRLAALGVLDILDTPPEPAFDGIAAAVKLAVGAPVVLVGFLDHDRHWFKAKEGLDFSESPRSISFCTHAIQQDEVMWVADAREDPRFRDGPLVAPGGPGVRFYAGAPIKADGGERVGTVCVLDMEPRAFDPAGAELLTRFAQMATDQLELRRHRRMRKIVGNLIGSTTDAMICADREGRVTLWNSAATAIFGWTSAEAVGRSLDMIVPAAHGPAHRAGFARVMAGGDPSMMGRTVEVPAVHKSGREFPVELSLSMWGSAEDRGVGAVIRDVTARKAAEEELRRTRVRMEIAGRETAAAHETMSLLVRSATTALVMTDADLRIIDVSDRWTESYGSARALVVGRSVHDVFPGARDHWEPIYRRCLGGARERGESSSALTDEGGKRWFQWEIAPWRDATGDVAGLLLTNHDVTDLVRAREVVELDRRRLNLAVDIADLVVWEADFQKGTLHVHGGDPEVLLGHPITFEALTKDQFMIVHDQDRDRAQAAWLRHLQDGEPYEVEHRLPRADQEIWVSSSVELVRDADGRAKAVLGVLTDITKRKIWEIETRRAHEAAEAANRVKSQFLANMSHEIRTPLNGVLGLAGVLETTRLDADQAVMVKMIEQSGRELEHMLTGMLDLVRLDGGGGEAVAEPLDLADLIRDAADHCAAAAASKGLEVRVEISGDRAGSACLGDPDRIRQALAQLADNAVKFTDRGSIVFGLDLASARRGVRARLSVTDTGVGFDPERAEALFERFTQADEANTRRHGGPGLGLSICRALAGAMGGTVEVRSVPGKGSTFTLVIDLELQAPELVAAA